MHLVAALALPHTMVLMHLKKKDNRAARVVVEHLISRPALLEVQEQVDKAAPEAPVRPPRMARVVAALVVSALMAARAVWVLAARASLIR